jgi:hypothetical protein
MTKESITDFWNIDGKVQLHDNVSWRYNGTIELTTREVKPIQTHYLALSLEDVSTTESNRANDNITK